MGHLFVVQADLTKLAVDHVLVPCDDQRNVHEGFLKGIDNPSAEATYPGLGGRYRQVILDVTGPGPWRATPTRDGPTPWLVNTATLAGDDDAALDALIKRITGAIEDIAAVEPKDRRIRIGLTLMGLREGGFARRYDEVVLRTITALEDACAPERAPDLVLALRHRADYAAVQHLRRSGSGGTDPGDGLGDAAGTARRLAELATAGRLVLFIGAGASRGAGLADWQGLLRDLAAKSTLQADDAALKKLDPRDAALLIASHMDGGTDGIRDEIARAFTPQRYSLTQALLASLHLDQAITTNYDTLYETAFAADAGAAERGLVVLPREPFIAGRPWLMKIHGDAEAPASIVLSRDDYMDFDTHSVPMASVLQSAMLTSHLLFVGYSVSDENIVRLARQVIRFREHHRRDAAQGRAEAPQNDEGAVGTVLVPRVNELKSKLWAGLLDFVRLPAVATKDGTAEPDAVAPDSTAHPDRTGFDAGDRNLLIFLDVLGRLACQEAPYFLVERYEGLLSAEEKALATELRSLKGTVDSATSTGSAAASAVRRLLGDLGMDIDPPGS